MKSGPRKHRNDRRISPAVAHEVERRDRGCIAALWLGAGSICRDTWANPVSAYDRNYWEFDHVNDFDLGVSHGVKERVVILCSYHHQQGWATSHRPLIRLYLEMFERGVSHPRVAGRAARKEAEGILSKEVT